MLKTFERSYYWNWDYTTANLTCISWYTYHHIWGAVWTMTTVWFASYLLCQAPQIRLRYNCRTDAWLPHRDDATRLYFEFWPGVLAVRIYLYPRRGENKQPSTLPLLKTDHTTTNNDLPFATMVVFTLFRYERPLQWCMFVAESIILSFKCEA